MRRAIHAIVPGQAPRRVDGTPSRSAAGSAPVRTDKCNGAGGGWRNSSRFASPAP